MPWRRNTGGLKMWNDFLSSLGDLTQPSEFSFSTNQRTSLHLLGHVLAFLPTGHKVLCQASTGLSHSFWKTVCYWTPEEMHLTLLVYLTQQDRPRPPKLRIMIRTLIFTWLCTSPKIWSKLSLFYTTLNPRLVPLRTHGLFLTNPPAASAQHPHYLCAHSRTWTMPRSQLPLKPSPVATLFSPIPHVWLGFSLYCWLLYAPW